MHSVRRLDFITTFLSFPKDSDLNRILEQVDSCNSDSQFKRLIDTILHRYPRDHEANSGVYVRNVLMEFFIKSASNKNLRKYMYAKLNLMKIQSDTFFEHLLNSVTKELTERISNCGEFNIPQCFQLLNFLFIYSQNLNDDSDYTYFQNKSVSFHLSILKVFSSHLAYKNSSRNGCEAKNILEYDDCYGILNATLKQLVLTVPRTFHDSFLPHCVEILGLFHDLMNNHDKLKFENLAHCARLFGVFLTIVPKGERESLKWPKNPILDFLDNEESDYSVVLKSKTLPNIFNTNRMKVILYSTVSSTIFTKALLETKIAQIPLLEFLYVDECHLAERVTSHPEEIIHLSKTIDVMSMKLSQLEKCENVFREGLTFCWAHLDHFVEQVVTTTKSIVGQLAELAFAQGQEGDARFLETFFTELNSMPTFSKGRMSAVHALSDIITSNCILEYCPRMPSHLLTLVATSALHSTAGDTYVNLMHGQLASLSIEEAIEVWLRPVLHVLKQPNIRHVHLLEEIITSAFKVRPELFTKLFHPTNAETRAECIVTLKCIRYARKNEIVFSVSGEDADDYWRNLLLKSKMEMFVVHQDDDVRINALQAIAECQKTTELFTEWELSLAIAFLQYNVSTQSSSFRNKMVTYYKKILARYQAGNLALVKQIANLEKKVERDAEIEQALAEAKDNMADYNDFRLHLVEILIYYLSPNSNYSRRYVSLELLLFQEFLTPCVFQQDDIDNLKHVLYDGYEGNKAMAVSLLAKLPSAKLGLSSEENTRSYFDKCMKMACDIRPSQSLTACYMLQLVLQSEFPFTNHKKTTKKHSKDSKCFMLMVIIEKLEAMFQSSNGDVLEAARSTPFYGLLLSARNLLRTRNTCEHNKVYAVIFNKLAAFCVTLKTHIMPVVGNSSPEGHIPDDEEDYSLLGSDQSSKAQMILVYAWKTMKEIMLLLAELANQTVCLENFVEMLQMECLVDIGNFFVDIFIQTKHRGVFEQAHLAFSTVCKSFTHSKKNKLNSLPGKWLDEAVALCTGKKTDDRLCPTRRSAGLPFLILSILPTLAERSRDHLRRAVDAILSVATDGDADAPRMHSLNVLRFLFNNSKMADGMTAYLDRGAIAALKGYRSRTWCVRNSSTLLLSTIINKMFGMPRSESSENRMTLAVFCVRFRKLFDFLLETLAEEYDKSDSLILHPVLLFLSRLYPSHNDTVNVQVQKYVPCINVCINNPSFRTRDLAARASVSLIAENDLQKQLGGNFDRIAEADLKDSECHGLLLQIRHIFQTATLKKLPISDYLTKSVHLLDDASGRFSHLTVSLYMDIVFMLLSKYFNYQNLAILKETVLKLSKQTQKRRLSTCGTSYAWSRFQLLSFILVNKFQHVGATYRIVTGTIVEFLRGNVKETKKKCLHFLIYLNQQYSKDQYKEHPLITSGEIEICPLTKALVHSFDFQSKKEILTDLHVPLLTHFGTVMGTPKQDKFCFVLILSLMRFYPCFFKAASTQAVFGWLLMVADCDEEITSAVIVCLRTFFASLSHSQIDVLKLEGLVKLLMRAASPAAVDHQRLSVAQFLVGTQILFKNKVLTEFDRYNMLNIMMVLLEDDEMIVRNTMSDFPEQQVDAEEACWSQFIPSKARFGIVEMMTSRLPNEVAVCCLVSWAIRRLPEVSADASEVYERGELNTYAENIPVTHCATEMLHALLWKLGDMLSYEDKSIFLEEQTLLVTTIVLNSLIKIPSPMVDKQTKRVVICVLRCISRFVEDSQVGDDFSERFTAFFDTKILKFLRGSLRHDYATVKSFLAYLYNPVLEDDLGFFIE